VFVCALTCFDALKWRERRRGEERREEKKKIVHSLVLSINVASIQTYRKRTEE
jgi:hypothetical protein